MRPADRADLYDRGVIFPGLPAWIPLVVVLFGLFFLASGVRTVLAGRQRAQTWRTVPGRVVASRLDDGQFRCQVAFTLDGREVRFWNRFTSSALSDPVGRDVEVLVDPDDPSQAVVSRGLVGASVVGLAFCAVGALATVIGLVLLS